jgi:hypothetical protein
MAGVQLDGESDEDYITRAARISGKITMVECLKKMVAMRDGSPQVQRDAKHWGDPCSSRILPPNTFDEIEPKTAAKYFNPLNPFLFEGGSGSVDTSLRPVIYPGDVFESMLKTKAPTNKPRLENIREFGTDYSTNISAYATNTQICERAILRLSRRPKTPKPHSFEPPKQLITLYRCRGCDKKDAKMLRCGRCKKVYYCNAVCQRAHWPAHKKACRQ